MSLISADWWKADFLLKPKLNAPLFHNSLTKEEAFEKQYQQEYAFTWDHTPEGGDLWVKVNYYWIKTVRAFNKQYQQEYVFTN